MRFDGYIRVSDTKGRSGENFLSPEIQRDTIKRLAQSKGVELNEPIIEELDVSGGKRVEDRELGRLIGRTCAAIERRLLRTAAGRLPRLSVVAFRRSPDGDDDSPCQPDLDGWRHFSVLR
jgi:hypothetical protein